MTEERFFAILEEEMEQLKQFIPDKVPLPPLNSKHVFIVLILVAMLSGISGYRIGVKTGKNTKSQFVLQTTPSLQASAITPLSPGASSIFSPAPSNDETGGETLWQTYADVKLGATFEYPTTWKVISNTTDNSITGIGTDYSIVFDDKTVPGNRVNIFVSSVNNPENLSLAEFYRKYAPGGAERFKNISFQETANPHGVRFEKIVQPYTNPDYSPFLETVHNNRVYEISATIPISLWSGVPLDSNYHQDPIFQKTLSGYNHLINTFTFMQ